MSALAWTGEATVHPAAELFPMMSEADFKELVDDIKENGLLESVVVTPEGEILDGRHRLLACKEAQVEPRFTTHAGHPWVFVISANLHRRHLTDIQRAVIAGKIANRAPGERHSNASADAFDFPVPAQQEAADLLRVSRTAVQRAKRVVQHGTPDMTALVEEGNVPLATAERVALTLSSDQQDEFVRKVRGGMLPRGAAPPEKDGANGVRRVRKPDAKPKAKVRDNSVITRDALQSLANDMGGLDVALKAINAVDPELSIEDKRTLDRSITRGIKAVGRIRRYLRTSTEGDQQP